MNAIQWYKKLARHCEDTPQLGSIQYKQLELLADFIAKEEAAEQSVHWTLPMCSVCGESVARKSGMCEDCEMLARQSQ